MQVYADKWTEQKFYVNIGTLQIKKWQNVKSFEE